MTMIRPEPPPLEKLQRVSRAGLVSRDPLCQPRPISRTKNVMAGLTVINAFVKKPVKGTLSQFE